MNTEVLPYIDDTGDFEFIYLGLDAKSDKERQELIKSQVSTYKKVNEIRTDRGLEEDPFGDIILDSVYLQNKQSIEQAESGKEEEGIVSDSEEVVDTTEEIGQSDTKGGATWKEWLGAQEK